MNILIRDGAESYAVKNEILKFITEDMNGVDIGSGGAPILMSSISMDRTKKGIFSNLIQLKGDAGDLYWFKDEVLDYVFSSHCLEDFVHEDKEVILREWLRVLKTNGHLILLLPDEQIYRKHCKETGQNYNFDHKDETFSLNKLRSTVKFTLNNMITEVYANEKVGPYSFLIIYKKVK